MFIHGQFEKGFAGTIISTNSEVAVHIEEGNLIFTVNDLQSFEELAAKLHQFLVTIDSIIQKEKNK